MNVLLLNLTSMKDGSGVYGHFFHYSLVLAMVGSALLIFLYLWKKGRLDFDEEPKMQMMEDQEKGASDG